MMMKQFSGYVVLCTCKIIIIIITVIYSVNFDDHLNEYQSYAEKFRTLPVHFMKFHGQTELIKVIEVQQIQLHPLEDVCLCQSLLFNGQCCFG